MTTETQCRNCHEALTPPILERYAGYCVDCAYANVPEKDTAIRVMRAALKIASEESSNFCLQEEWFDRLAKWMVRDGKCTEQEVEYVRRLCDE